MPTTSLPAYQQASQHHLLEIVKAALPVQDGKPGAANEQLQELASLKERLQQMTNRMGQMEQKVCHTHSITW